MKYVILFFLISLNAGAAINGSFYSEFKRNNADCAIQATLTQKNINQLTLKNWDELCEDAKGNSEQSSLQDVMVYEKIGDKKLKVYQGSDSVELDAKVLEFTENFVHYNFETDTDDGHLEINESFTLRGNDLTFSSLYLLDGKEIINKSGTIQRNK